MPRVAIGDILEWISDEVRDVIVACVAVLGGLEKHIWRCRLILKLLRARIALMELLLVK